MVVIAITFLLGRMYVVVGAFHLTQCMFSSHLYIFYSRPLTMEHVYLYIQVLYFKAVIVKSLHSFYYSHGLYQKDSI